MTLFLDTSSLFKLYHKEEGTIELENLFLTQEITGIFLSDISKIEFTSTIWKKVRTKEILQTQALETLYLFKSDFDKYTFISAYDTIFEQARHLVTMYGSQGLRTLDSIQLSTAVLLSKHVDVFLTADKLLQTLFVAEGLPIEIT